MTEIAEPNHRTARRGSSIWSEVIRKEDWWAIWIGIGLIAVAVACSRAVKASSGSRLRRRNGRTWRMSARNCRRMAVQYLALFALWSVLFGIAASALGFRPARFVASFALHLRHHAGAVFPGPVGSGLALQPRAAAGRAGAGAADLEHRRACPGGPRPGCASSFMSRPASCCSGPSLPLTLIAWAGPVAIVQAAIVSLVTFGVIYLAAVRLGLDRRLAAVLGTGGAVCGVSGSIAVGGAVGARREHVSIAISLVVLWAIVMIFVLPLVSRALGLSTGVAGAWIGTSEFADAAGLAAAQAYGGYAGNVAGIHGSADAAVSAFTLMKVIGRDIWIGVWALVLSVVATARWEVDRRAQPRGARRDLAALPQVRARVSAGLGDHHRGGAGAQLCRLQAVGRARPGGAAAGAAHLGVHVRVPEHRADHAGARFRLGRCATVLCVHDWRRRQRGARLRSVDAGVQRFLDAPGPMTVP